MPNYPLIYLIYMCLNQKEILDFQRLIVSILFKFNYCFLLLEIIINFIFISFN